MRTSALRRCAPVLRHKPRHGNVLRLHGQSVRRRTGGTGRDGSDPPVRGPGAGFGARCVCAPPAPPLRVAPGPPIPAGRRLAAASTAAIHPRDDRSSVEPRSIGRRPRHRSWARHGKTGRQQRTPGRAGWTALGIPSRSSPSSRSGARWPSCKDCWLGATPQRRGGWGCTSPSSPMPIEACRDGGSLPSTAKERGSASAFRWPWCNRKRASDMGRRRRVPSQARFRVRPPPKCHGHSWIGIGRTDSGPGQRLPSG